MKKDRAIGIFDSGMGGLSVLDKNSRQKISYSMGIKKMPLTEKKQKRRFVLYPWTPIAFFRKKG